MTWVAATGHGISMVMVNTLPSFVHLSVAPPPLSCGRDSLLNYCNSRSPEVRCCISGQQNALWRVLSCHLERYAQQDHTQASQHLSSTSGVTECISSPFTCSPAQEPCPASCRTQLLGTAAVTMGYTWLK